MPARAKRPADSSPWVGVIMGSKSDLRVMSVAVDLLRELEIPHEVRVVSAHRTPDWMFEYASSAESRGIEVIIAAAGGAAHLPGMVAAKSLVPVLGVPIHSTSRGSNLTFLSPSACSRTNWLFQTPAVSPSRSALLAMWLARTRLPAPGMLSTAVEGLPGTCLPKWRAMARV